MGQDGSPIGSCPVIEAHSPPGRLHRAFSVMLVGPDGRLLMHRRALTKSRFPGRWTNTCCSHPAPGVDPAESARERLLEELGIEVGALREVGRFVYRAEDPATGTVEHEYDHVLVGEWQGEPVLDPAEVHSVEWRSPDEAWAQLQRAPDQHSPWLRDVLRFTIG